jgi:hypothetical protein
MTTFTVPSFTTSLESSATTRRHDRPPGESSQAAWTREMERMQLSAWLGNGPLPTGSGTHGIAGPVPAPDAPTKLPQRWGSGSHPLHMEEQQPTSDEAVHSVQGRKTFDGTAAARHSGLAEAAPSVPPYQQHEISSRCGDEQEREAAFIAANPQMTASASVSRSGISPADAGRIPKMADGRKEILAVATHEAFTSADAPAIRTSVFQLRIGPLSPYGGANTELPGAEREVDEPTDAVFAEPADLHHAVADPSRNPVRIHTEWSGRTVRVWIGADASAELTEDAVAYIVQELQKNFNQQGAILASLTCNGRTVNFDKERNADAIANEAASDADDVAQGDTQPYSSALKPRGMQ